jgi:hypothetical protein
VIAASPLYGTPSIALICASSFVLQMYRRGASSALSPFTCIRMNARASVVPREEQIKWSDVLDVLHSSDDVVVEVALEMARVSAPRRGLAGVAVSC